MKKIVLLSSALLCLWITPSAFAHSDGEIRFQGSVIEEYSCQAIQANHQVQLDCSINNNTLSKSDIVFHSQLEYIDQEKNLAVMHITYN